MKHHSKTSLFLMELILAILIFSLCSAICVRLFVTARQVEQDAADLSNAAFLCDSTASRIQAGKSPDTVPDAAWFDADFHPCAPEEAIWLLSVSEAERDGVLCGHITVTAVAGKQNASSNDTDAADADPLYELYVGY